MFVYLRKEERMFMTSKSVKVTNAVGLHARPATFFIQKANEYQCNIWVEKGDCRQNAKSLLGILSMAITKDTVIDIIADGVDETEAIEGLTELLNGGIEDRT